MLGRLNMKYWPPQLNVALWCATTCSGISLDILLDMRLTSQLRALFHFHVYFTTRRILFRKGGIRSVNTLPEEPTLSQTNNPYGILSYKSICAELGVEPTTDFRFPHGANRGLGNVFIYVSRYGPTSTGTGYPSLHPKFCNEGGQANQGNLVTFIRKDGNKTRQFDYFVPDKASRLTPPGLSCVNQSIEAFVYCTLGAQVNVRSSILGDGDRAKEAQSEFLVLLEDAIRQPGSKERAALPAGCRPSKGTP